ncbi:MAG: hypothetical protein ABI606_16165 [Rhodoferax sp.]
MPKLIRWLGPARLPFLVLTPACIVLGVAGVAPVLMAFGIVMS